MIIGGSPSDGNGGDGSAALESSPRPPSVVHGRNVHTPSTGPPNPVPSKVGFNGKALKCARLPGNGRKQINITTLTGVTPLLVDRRPVVEHVRILLYFSLGAKPNGPATLTSVAFSPALAFTGLLSVLRGDHQLRQRFSGRCV